MSVMQINPLLKIAMRQLKGIELKQTDKELVLVLRSRFSWFRVSIASFVLLFHRCDAVQHQVMYAL